MASSKVELIDVDDWQPSRWHHVRGYGTKTWRVTDAGVEVRGEPLPELSDFNARMMSIVADYGTIVSEKSHQWDVDIEMMCATIGVESGGDCLAERHEKELGDYSIGLTQVLTSTASELAARKGIQGLPSEPLPKGGKLSEWRDALRRPDLAIELCAAYHYMSNERFGCQSDPILLYAAYNAGSPRSADTDWGLRYYGQAMDHFRRWYNAACEVLGRGPL